MADTDDWGGIAVSSQPKTDDWGGIAVNDATTAIPNMDGVKTLAQKNLAAVDNKEVPEGSEAPTPMTSSQRLDAAIGTPVNKLLNPNDQDPIPADLRKEYVKSIKDGTTSSFGDFMQNALHTVLPEIGNAYISAVKGAAGQIMYPFLSDESKEELLKDKQLTNYENPDNPTGLDLARRGIELEQGTIGQAMGGLYAPIVAATAPIINPIMQAIPDIAEKAGVNSGWAGLIPGALGVGMDVIGLGGVIHASGKLGIEPSIDRSKPPVLQTPIAGIWDNLPNKEALDPHIAKITGKDANNISSSDIDNVIEQGTNHKAPLPADFKAVETVTNGVVKEDTLHSIYAETGIKPDEVLHDAQRNPEIAEQVALGRIPDAYLPEPHTAYYDFDTDTYAVKGGGKEPITGFDRLEDAQNHANEKNGIKKEDLVPSYITDVPSHDYIDIGRAEEQSAIQEVSNKEEGIRKQLSADAIEKEKPTLGEQTSIPGTEAISEKQLAERKMNEPMRGKVEQKPMGEGIFDMGARIPQEDLFKQKPKGVIPPSEMGRSTNLRAFLNNNGAKFNEANDLLSIKRGKEVLKGQDALNYAHDISKEYGYLPKDEADMPPRMVRELQDALTEKNGGREVFRDADADKVAKAKEAADAKKWYDPSFVEHEAYNAGIDTDPLEGETEKQTTKRLVKALEEFYKNQSGSVSSNVLKDIRDIISPTMAGEGAKRMAEGIRRAYGLATRRRAIDEAELERFARQSSILTEKPEELSKFYKYIEGRSKGAVLSDLSLQQMADAIRSVYSKTRVQLESMSNTKQMRFVQDYFSHQWKDEDAANKFSNDFIASQGSTRNLKQRIIPTIEEGITAGLELKEPNPVRAVSRYIANMNNYVASVDALRTVHELGGEYYVNGRHPEGFEPLVGKNLERVENTKIDEKSGKLIPARSLQLYAPSDVATIFNRFYSKGLEDTKAKSVYEVIKGAENANTLMELGLSTYHAGTITIQSITQDLQRVAKNAAVGDWKGAVDAARQAITPAFIPGSHYLEGSKGIEQYKKLASHGIDMEAMADHFAQSNLHLGLDPLSRMGHRGIVQVAQRGELPELINHLKNQAKNGYGLGLLQSGAEIAGRVVSDISAPLFNHYIPRIKFDSFANLMGDWLRQNPKASQAEIQIQQVRIGNLVDDRFGELNMDNVFWNKMLKQFTGLTFRAVGWDLGLVRQIAGPPLDIYRMLSDAVTGKGFNPDLLDRPLYLLSGAVLYAAMNSAMTYIKTGIPPSEQNLEDFINYRTGGTTHTLGKNYEERGVLPGHAKEVLNLIPLPHQAALSGLASEVSAKVMSLPKNLWDAFMNQDWNGKPLYQPESKDVIASTPILAQAAHVAKGFIPMSVTNFQNVQPNSNLSFMERALGVKAGGAKIVAPDELGNYLEHKSKNH